MCPTALLFYPSLYGQIILYRCCYLISTTFIMGDVDFELLNQPLDQIITLTQISQPRHSEVIGTVQDRHGDISIDRLQLLCKLQTILRFDNGVR